MATMRLLDQDDLSDSVCAELRLEHLDRCIGDPQHAPRAGMYGIEDEYVEPLPARRDGIDRSTERVEIGEVGDQRHRLRTTGIDLSRGGFEAAFDLHPAAGVGVVAALALFGGACRERDIEAGVGQRDRARAADAPTRAGNKRHRM